MRRSEAKFKKPDFKIDVKKQLPEIILFTGPNFDGEEIRTYCNIDYVGDEQNEIRINDNINSIIVISGEWKIYQHAGFRGDNQYLEVGYYDGNDLKEMIAKGISSAKCVKQ